MDAWREFAAAGHSYVTVRKHDSGITDVVRVGTTRLNVWYFNMSATDVASEATYRTLIDHLLRLETEGQKVFWQHRVPGSWSTDKAMVFRMFYKQIVRSTAYNVLPDGWARDFTARVVGDNAVDKIAAPHVYISKRHNGQTHLYMVWPDWFVPLQDLPNLTAKMDMTFPSPKDTRTPMPVRLGMLPCMPVGQLYDSHTRQYWDWPSKLTDPDMDRHEAAMFAIPYMKDRQWTATVFDHQGAIVNERFSNSRPDPDDDPWCRYPHWKMRQTTDEPNAQYVKEMITDADAVVRYLNQFIAQVHGNVYMMKVVAQNPITGQREVVVEDVSYESISSDLREYRWFDPLRGKEGAYVSAFKTWLEHPMKNKYKRIVYLPDAYDGRSSDSDVWNTWRGFDVNVTEAEEAVQEWDRLNPDNTWDENDPLNSGPLVAMLEHLLECIHRGDKDRYEMFLDWLAWIRQRPGQKTERCVIWVGAEGIGKSLWGEFLVKLFAPYAVILTRKRDMIGQFSNTQIAEKVVCTRKCLTRSLLCMWWWYTAC